MVSKSSLKSPSFFEKSRSGFPKCKFLEFFEAINPYGEMKLSCPKSSEAEILIKILFCPFFHFKTGECRKI